MSTVPVRCACGRHRAAVECVGEAHGPVTVRVHFPGCHSCSRRQTATLLVQDGQIEHVQAERLGLSRKVSSV